MNNPLGKQSALPREYSPHVLFAVPRSAGRSSLGLSEVPFIGVDTWNCYEISWLDSKGIPQQAVLRFDVPCMSPSLVESKSLKLYLGGFAFERVERPEVLLETITRDVSGCVGEPLLGATLLSCDDPELVPSTAPGQCVDAEIRPGGGDTWHTHLFRSLCPVTAQPDWATVIVRGKGGYGIADALRRFVIQRREHQAFHESCTEELFCDIWRECRPERLAVLACFTRRGGIDINPMRASDPMCAIPYKRLLRQ